MSISRACGIRSPGANNTGDTRFPRQLFSLPNSQNPHSGNLNQVLQPSSAPSFDFAGSLGASVNSNMIVGPENLHPASLDSAKNTGNVNVDSIPTAPGTFDDLTRPNTGGSGLPVSTGMSSRASDVLQPATSHHVIDVRDVEPAGSLCKHSQGTDGKRECVIDVESYRINSSRERLTPASARTWKRPRGTPVDAVWRAATGLRQGSNGRRVGVNVNRVRNGRSRRPRRHLHYEQICPEASDTEVTNTNNAVIHDNNRINNDTDHQQRQGRRTCQQGICGVHRVCLYAVFLIFCAFLLCPMWMIAVVKIKAWF
jgi:hypothetical protein